MLTRAFPGELSHCLCAVGLPIPGALILASGSGGDLRGTGGGGASRGASGGSGGSGGGPGGPEEPDIEWSRSGTIDPNKFDPYLFNPEHPQNQDKARLWRSFFDVGQGDGPLLERLIKEQLDQAAIEERGSVIFSEDPPRVARRWELVIPRFEVPNGNVASVLTAWALDPGNDLPHFVTAYPLAD